jgi:hypothetical protein
MRGELELLKPDQCPPVTHWAKARGPGNAEGADRGPKHRVDPF